MTWFTLKNSSNSVHKQFHSIKIRYNDYSSTGEPFPALLPDKNALTVQHNL